MLKNIDPSLGVPLPDKDYGGSCRIYDWEHPEDPFHYFKVDEAKNINLIELIAVFLFLRTKWIVLFYRIFLVGG